VSLTTIFVGYGDGLVSGFGDRASIAVTLMLTVVAWETPEQLRSIRRVQNVKTATFFLITLVIIKDVFFTAYWWKELYWHSGQIAEEKPEGWSSVFNGNNWGSDLLLQGSTIDARMLKWRRLWRTDAVTTVLLLVIWMSYFGYLTFGVRFYGKLGPRRAILWVYRKLAKAEDRWEKEMAEKRMQRNRSKFGDVCNSLPLAELVLQYNDNYSSYITARQHLTSGCWRCFQFHFHQ
jgi:hypothetical protein